MAQRLLNKVAVVTGASGGIGRAIVQRFLTEGAKVVVFARSRGPLEDLAGIAPARVLVMHGDVTRPGDLDALAQATVRRFGSVDVLVPAAGIVRSAPLDQSTPEVLSEILAVNFHGAVQTVRAFHGQLNPGASIVFLSASADHASASGLGGFCASKAALASLARTMAVEFAPRGIRVNCVAPGWTDRGRSPLIADAAGARNGPRNSAKTGTLANDVAETVVFLASDAAPNIIGQEIVVDGARDPDRS